MGLFISSLYIHHSNTLMLTVARPRALATLQLKQCRAPATPEGSHLKTQLSSFILPSAVSLGKKQAVCTQIYHFQNISLPPLNSVNTQ